VKSKNVFHFCFVSSLPLSFVYFPVPSPLHQHTHISLSPSLVFTLSADWELKRHTPSSQLPVHITVCVESVVNTTPLLLVQDDLHQLAAVLAGTDTLSDDLDWVDDIGEDGVVDGGECSRSWALLGLGCAGTVGTFWAGEDAALGKDDDVAVGELLFEFTGQSLLDLVEALEERNWDEDDNCLLSVANIELTGRDELQRSQSSLQVGGVGLKFVEGSCDLCLQLRGLRPRGAVVCDLVDGCHDCDWSG